LQRRILQIGAVIVGVVILFAVLSFIVVNRVNAQNDVVSDLKSRLTAQGVPIKSIQIVSRLPFKLEIQLQSQSKNQIATPDDATFEALVERELAVAHRRDINIDAVKVSILNANGTAIFWADVPVRSLPQKQERRISTDEAKGLLSTQLPLNGMKIATVQVSETQDGDRVLTANVSADSVAQANKALPGLMGNLPRIVEDANGKGAAISVFNLNIQDQKGNVLLKYSFDAELQQESWWQAEGVSQDWFPHPPTASP